MSEAQNETTPVVDPEAEGLPSTADDDSTAYDDTESARVADGPDPAALPADHPVGSLDYGTTPAEARTAEPLSDRLDREVPEPDPYAEAADPTDPTDPANVSDRPDPGDDTVDPSDPDYDPEAGGAIAVTGAPGASPGLDDTTGASGGTGGGSGGAAGGGVDAAGAGRLSESPDAVGDGPDPDGTLTGAPSDGLVDVTGADPTDTDELGGSEETIPDPTELLGADELPADGDVVADGTDARWDDEPADIGRLVAPDEGAHPDREGTEIAQDTGAAGGGLSAEEAAIHEER